MQASSPLPRPKAVLFDAYGTLFDVYSVAALAEEIFPALGQALCVMWRDKQIEYTRLTTTSARHDTPPNAKPPFYQPFDKLTLAALRYSCARLGLPLSAEDEARLMQQYLHLSAFADALPVLQNLQGKGIPTGILSNGEPAMLESAVQTAGLAGLLQHVLSVDGIGKYKTHPEAYALGTKATGLAPQEILFVSSNSWDALAATWWGYQTFWVNRAKLPFETLGVEPTYTGGDLHDIVKLFY